jgi:HPt (histidine-containing phosphotransfer) domain-containing protein
MIEPIDIDRLRDLFSDDDVALFDLLRATVEQTRLVTNKINEAVLGRDASAAAAAAHELKGFAGNVGALLLADLAALTESEIAALHWPAVAIAYTALSVEADRVVDFVTESLSAAENAVK